MGDLSVVRPSYSVHSHPVSESTWLHHIQALLLYIIPTKPRFSTYYCELAPRMGHTVPACRKKKNVEAVALPSQWQINAKETCGLKTGSPGQSSASR